MSFQKQYQDQQKSKTLIGQIYFYKACVQLCQIVGYRKQFVYQELLPLAFCCYGKQLNERNTWSVLFDETIRKYLFTTNSLT